ncbi:ABC transporter substrate-binding protein [Paenibacillus radicis (ex Xue et al. 2023)]|uniref:Extracellular solute-binding protein n=1 Tax=Paenibacillus radicis (ex Xue et al. 2023) TaxID=2972489 RepID=A0ABT1YIW4_9BACL|nr:extracellular solute-binding protein [Paenibacillus radicis (ex Xue et al. 2023)]MCR8633114.1 extracellular solute-binding protein [Paenibacillus radicis (ex Xue et al. 2023)]
MKKKGKVAGSFLTGLALMVMLAACSTKTENGSAPDAGNKPAAKGDVTAASEWAEKNGLNKTETTDELYTKAKGEGKVVVYSQSSRIKDVKATFEAKYPGVKVEAFNMSTNDIVEKVIREQGAGIYNADVIFVKDASGAVTTELTTKKLVHKYIPKDLSEKMVEPYKSKSSGLVPYFSLRAIFYNTDVYKTPPVTNWWDLTQPEWKGKVLLNDPIDSADMMDLFLAMVQHSDEMKQAYKDKFGKDIVLNGTENAAYEFFKQFLKNDPVLMKSSDEVVEAVGVTAQGKPPIGIGASSKLRDVIEKKLSIAATYDVKPRISVVGPSYLYVADKAPNVNAAKLMIRYMAGEADGKSDGFKPFNVMGSWSTRTDNGRTDQLPIDKLNVWDYDSDYFYKNFVKFREFWLKMQ